jgi:hypothetical protein
MEEICDPNNTECNLRMESFLYNYITVFILLWFLWD